MIRIAVYPGTFDPITNGHLDVVLRAAAVFDELVVAVHANPNKTPLLDLATRIQVVETALSIDHGAQDGIRVVSFDGLTVDLCRELGAIAIERGLRAVADFEFERQLADNNRVLAPAVDSVFFMAAGAHRHVSSSLVKEIASHGGDVSTMIPATARDAIAAALRGR
ncbi:MAG: pantetheine-phosphate adenylyltransferase [Chloroflexi bacterium]|nr:pantetheine-phosphate adenylyltransferase [Chloroflexota bacterium]